MTPINTKELSNKRIAVVGSGIAGLSAAYELKKIGYEVDVYEKALTPGGRMATRRKDGLAFDIGADFLSGKYLHLRTYADELGVDWHPTEANGKHRVIKKGIPHYLDLKRARDVLSMGMLSWRARLSFAWWLVRLSRHKTSDDFFDLSTIDPANDLENGSVFLAKNVHTDVRDYLADPFTSIMQFHLTDDISAGAMMAFLRMMTAGDGFRVQTTAGGLGALPEALAHKVGVTYGTGVRTITRAPGSIRVETDHGESYLYDAVVLATTARIAQTLIVEPTPSEEKLLRSVQYAHTIVVAYKVPVRTFADGTHISYVPFVDNETIGGYTNEERKGPDFVHNGSTLINVYLHENAAKKLEDAAPEEIARIVLIELKKVCPEIRADNFPITFHDLAHWKEAMPKFYAGHLTNVMKFLKDGQGEGNLFLAGDYLNAPWTEGASRSGVRAAGAVAARFLHS